MIVQKRIQTGLFCIKRLNEKLPSSWHGSLRREGDELLFQNRILRTGYASPGNTKFIDP